MGLHMDNKKGKPPVLVLEGDAGIAMASEIKKAIMDAMAETDTLTIDVENVENFDISCFQLLCASNQSFERKTKQLSLVTGKNRDLCRKLLTGAGYEQSGGCPEQVCKRCLWKGEG